MKCTECGNKMTKTVGDHVYRESGLDNVVLHNIAKYSCESCGAKRVTIPNMGPLHRAIAQAIAEKPARLVPQEVRFLRDHLGLSNKAFAALMGVSPEQASRWASSDAVGIPAERFLRLLATIGPYVVQAAQHEPTESIGVMDASTDEFVAAVANIKRTLEHLPPPSAPTEDVRINIRRTGASEWKSEHVAAN